MSQCLSAACVGHVFWGVCCCSSNLEKLNELSSKGSAQTSTLSKHTRRFIVTLYSALSGCIPQLHSGKVLVSTRESLILEMAEAVNVPCEICFPYSLFTLASRV